MKNVASEERHLELPEVTHFVEEEAEGLVFALGAAWRKVAPLKRLRRFRPSWREMKVESVMKSRSSRRPERTMTWMHLQALECFEWP
eukprot:symbB.v1.2.037719.t1/scaffold5647.1/size24966/3